MYLVEKDVKFFLVPLAAVIESTSEPKRKIVAAKEDTNLIKTHLWRRIRIKKP